MSKTRAERAAEIAGLKKPATETHRVHVFAGEELLISDQTNQPVAHFRFEADLDFYGRAHDMAALIAEYAEAEAQHLARIAELEKVCGPTTAHSPVGPDRCPFTGRRFWGNIEHPDLGWVATYGGPYDTYTIPQRTNDDPDYFVYRYDHDLGGWEDSVESIGKAVVDDQLYTSEDDPAELAARIAELEAQLAEATKDAERYRLLRTMKTWVDQNIFNGRLHVVRRMEELDSELDTFLASRGKS